MSHSRHKTNGPLNVPCGVHLRGMLRFYQGQSVHYFTTPPTTG
jgi:hypothetical protein